MPVRLILHADDFGLAPGINQAILELHHAGVLSSASLMSTAAHAAEAASMARQHPALGVGCHLTFVDGLPAADPARISSLLASDGHFHATVAEFVRALVRGRVSPAELEHEARTQIHLLQKTGVLVTHVDTHKHLHALPPVAGAVLRAARSCGIRAVRTPFEPGWSTRHSGAPWLRRAEVCAMRRLGRHLRQQVRASGLQTPTGTLGIAATGTLDEPALRATLRAVAARGEEEVWELCCHPGYLDDSLRTAHTRLLRSRESELHALLRVVPEFLAQNQSSPGALRLIHYGELADAGLRGRP